MSKINSEIEYIVSMAQMRDVVFSDPNYSIQFYGLDEGKRERHNMPHVHLVWRGESVAVISLNNPVTVIEKYPKADEKPKILKEAVEAIQENIYYWHFLWDLYTSQTFYTNEYRDDLELVTFYCKRHDINNPSRLLGAKYLTQHNIK